MDGSATFTMDTSRTTMRYATPSTASACQRLGSGVVISLISPRSSQFVGPLPHRAQRRVPTTQRIGITASARVDYRLARNEAGSGR
jgi:hypothetical protein